MYQIIVSKALLSDRITYKLENLVSARCTGARANSLEELLFNPIFNFPSDFIRKHEQNVTVLGPFKKLPAIEEVRKYYPEYFV